MVIEKPDGTLPQGRATTSILRQAVVRDVIYDYASISPERLEAIEIILAEGTTARADDILSSCPRNTLIISEISNRRGITSPGASLAIPMFPPHLMMPIKPGENVWIIDPTPDTPSDVVYWLSRVPSYDFVDDINFTHADRILQEIPSQQGSDKKVEKPEFSNGDIVDPNSRTPTLTNTDLDNKKNEFQLIHEAAYANKVFTYEPVPRFIPRPGDMVLQGSNNTLICLGGDRGYTGIKRPSSAAVKFSNDEATEPNNRSNASLTPDGNLAKGGKGAAADPAKSNKGSIDMVAGRGQDDATKPKVIGNSWEFDEVNKNPAYFGGLTDDNQTFNPTEGDPDFISDLSRVYVSMKTSGDKNLGLQYPEFASPGGTAETDATTPHRAFVIGKSDEVRIVSREDGSVRITKEGTVAGNQCIITMLPDGTVAIDAKKILVGDGRNAQTYIGDPKMAGSEPLALGNTLKAKLESFMEAYEKHVHTTGTSCTTPLNLADVTAIRTSMSETISKTAFTAMGADPPPDE